MSEATSQPHTSKKLLFDTASLMSLARVTNAGTQLGPEWYHTGGLDFLLRFGKQVFLGRTVAEELLNLARFNDRHGDAARRVLHFLSQNGKAFGGVIIPTPREQLLTERFRTASADEPKTKNRGEAEALAIAFERQTFVVVTDDTGAHEIARREGHPVISSRHLAQAWARGVPPEEQRDAVETAWSLYNALDISERFGVVRSRFTFEQSISNPGLTLTPEEGVSVQGQDENQLTAPQSAGFVRVYVAPDLLPVIGSDSQLYEALQGVLSVKGVVALRNNVNAWRRRDPVNAGQHRFLRVLDLGEAQRTPALLLSQHFKGVKGQIPPDIAAATMAAFDPAGVLLTTNPRRWDQHAEAVHDLFGLNLHAVSPDALFEAIGQGTNEPRVWAQHLVRLQQQRSRTTRHVNLRAFYNGDHARLAGLRPIERVSIEQATAIPGAGPPPKEVWLVEREAFQRMMDEFRSDSGVIDDMLTDLAEHTGVELRVLSPMQSQWAEISPADLGKRIHPFGARLTTNTYVRRSASRMLSAMTQQPDKGLTPETYGHDLYGSTYNAAYASRRSGHGVISTRPEVHEQLKRELLPAEVQAGRAPPTIHDYPVRSLDDLLSALADRVPDHQRRRIDRGLRRLGIEPREQIETQDVSTTGQRSALSDTSQSVEQQRDTDMDDDDGHGTRPTPKPDKPGPGDRFGARATPQPAQPPRRPLPEAPHDRYTRTSDQPDRPSGNATPRGDVVTGSRPREDVDDQSQDRQPPKANVRSMHGSDRRPDLDRDWTHGFAGSDDLAEPLSLEREFKPRARRRTDGPSTAG